MRKTLTAYIDEATKAKLDYIRNSYMERSPGVPMSDSATVIKTIDDVYQKIEGKDTNANRITTIIERLDKMEATNSHLVELIDLLAEAIERLERKLG